MVMATVGIAAAYAGSGGAMFSPGALHAGDSTRKQYGGVQSHAQLGRDCSACHAVVGSARPMATRCLDCHTNIQRELRDTASLHGALTSVRSCTSCHTEHKGATASLTSTEGFGGAHAKFGFALDAHVKLANGRAFTCANCHSASSFKFQASTCVSCHREYQATFTTAHIASWGNNCQSCHDGTDRFSRGRFKHDSTAFQLTGAHVQTRCVACHVGVTELSGYAKAPKSCASCHNSDDKHRGSFGTDCASCHTTASWKNATFEHTVFPIDHGESGPSSCVTCHKIATDYKSYTCYGCHEHSPARVQAQHRGEVRTQNLDKCLACHGGGRREGGERGERNGEERRGRDGER